MDIQPSSLLQRVTFQAILAIKQWGLLREAGNNYIYMREELGGYRQAGYQDFTTTSEFQSGLQELEEITQKRSMAIILLINILTLANFNF